ncbi:MAG: hypothetical protein IKM76_02790, partial [Prevotella sp.]|nr:hypothetical protein [Prevotella sp.]
LPQPSKKTNQSDRAAREQNKPLGGAGSVSTGTGEEASICIKNFIVCRSTPFSNPSRLENSWFRRIFAEEKT